MLGFGRSLAVLGGYGFVEEILLELLGFVLHGYSALRYGNIDFVAYKQHEAVEVDPKHQHQQSTDRTVEDVVAVEGGEVYLESPGESEKEYGSYYGSDGEEAYPLFLAGGCIVDEAYDHEGKEGQYYPADEADDETVEGGKGYEAMLEQPGDDGVVAQLEHDDEDDQQVEQEYQQETDGVALEKRTRVDSRIGVVERHDHAMHTVAGKEDGGCKADGEQAVVPVAHNLGNGGLYHIIDRGGEDVFQLYEEGLLEAFDGEEGDESEEEDEHGRNGREEGVGQPLGSLPQSAVGYAQKEEPQHLPYGYALAAGQGEMMQKIDALHHPPLEQHVA